MATRFYTVLVLPDATSPARKFHIHRSVLTGLSVFAALLFLAFGFFTYQYVNLNVRMLELKQLRQEVRDQSHLAQKVSQLEGDLSRLRDLDRRVRVAAGLGKADAQEPVLAEGGAVTPSRTALLEAVKEQAVRPADSMNHDLDVPGAGDHLSRTEFPRVESPLGGKAVPAGLDPDHPPRQGPDHGRFRLPAIALHGTARDA